MIYILPSIEYDLQQVPAVCSHTLVMPALMMLHVYKGLCMFTKQLLAIASDQCALVRLSCEV